MRLYVLGLVVIVVWQFLALPKFVSKDSIAIHTRPEGAHVLRTQSELFVNTRGQSGSGVRRVPMGTTPGPIALDARDLPLTLVFELPGYQPLARTFPAGSFPSDRLHYPEALKLEPRLPGIGLIYWLRDWPSVPLLTALIVAFATRRRRQRRGLAVEVEMLKRHRQGDFRPGDSVAGWKLVRRLGAGGAGQVFEAVRGSEKVALKLIFGELHREQFQAEVRAWKDMADPGIVFLLGWGEWEGQAYLLLEFVPGETLADRLEREGRLEPSEVRRVGREVAAALQAVHRAGFIHRDLKPANLLFCSSDDRSRVRLSDFGLAAVAGISGSLAGTTGYLAPEGFEGALGYPADVYALGVVLFQCLTGKLPFQGGSPLETMRLQREGKVEVPPGWELLARMLDPAPEARPNLDQVKVFLDQGP